MVPEENQLCLEWPLPQGRPLQFLQAMLGGSPQIVHGEATPAVGS